MLDQFDLKILELIQKDSKMPQRDISAAVNLSASAVNRRISAMERDGVILRHAAIVDPAKVGRPISIIVEVSLESERLDHLDKVRKRFTQCPQVNQVYYVTGEVDFVLILNVKDMAEFETLTRELFFAEGNVKRFRTLVVMDRTKMTLDVPMV